LKPINLPNPFDPVLPIPGDNPIFDPTLPVDPNNPDIPLDPDDPDNEHGSGEEIDYYARLAQAIKTKDSFCSYTDEEYEKIDFQDLVRSPEKSSIMALRHFCIVKGRGDALDAYEPNTRMSRAEFIKMLVKIYYIGQGVELFDEDTPYEGELLYKDITNDHWSAKYISLAKER
jgi:hypothetical protein